MRQDVPCEFPAGYDGSALMQRLAQVLDPELDESILDLGFVRGVRVYADHAEVALRLPTSWCAVNFAFLMAQDVRRALIGLDLITAVTIRLGDHCAASEIEAAVNDGRTFAEAFPGEGAGSLAALRLTFLRKGFLIRQERLIHQLRTVGCSPAMICALRLRDLSLQSDRIVLRQREGISVTSGAATAALLQRYVERRCELALDCSPAAALIIDLEGKPFSAEGLLAHYEAARTMRVALEANGSFCRALIERASSDPAQKAEHKDRGGRHVQP